MSFFLNVNSLQSKFRTIGGVVALSAMTIVAASCKKDVLDTSDLQIVGVERTINATAAIPQDGDKAYLDYADGRKVKWELTDALNINGTNVALSSLNADAITARFEGTTYAIPSGGNDIYWAVYPTTIAGAASGSSIPSNFTATTLKVNFPATQTYNSSSNALSGNTLMAGYASVPAGDEHILFQMRNLGTVLKLTLKADASATNKFASRIEFTTTNGALAGAFSVSNGSTPTVTPTANVTKVLTVNLTDGTNNYIDLSTPKEIYVILPPLASKNLTMTIYNTQKNKPTKLWHPRLWKGTKSTPTPSTTFVSANAAAAGPIFLLTIASKLFLLLATCSTGPRQAHGVLPSTSGIS